MFTLASVGSPGGALAMFIVYWYKQPGPWCKRDSNSSRIEIFVGPEHRARPGSTQPHLAGCFCLNQGHTYRGGPLGAPLMSEMRSRDVAAPGTVGSLCGVKTVRPTPGKTPPPNHTRKHPAGAPVHVWRHSD